MAYSKLASISKSVLLVSGLLVIPCSCAYITISHPRGQTLFKSLSAGSHHISPYIIPFAVAWSLIELAFYFYFIHTKNRLQQTTKPKKPLNQRERKDLYWNCLKSIDTINIWSEGWFYYKNDHSHPQFKDIQRENLALWFAWAFWHDHLDIVRQNEPWANEIEWMLSTAEDWFHVTFTKGLNPKLECIRLNLDPVQAVHRPLLMYLMLYLVTSVFNVIFLQTIWGFTHAGVMASGVVWGGALEMFENTLQSLKAAIVVPHQKAETSSTTATPSRDKLISYWYRSASTEKKSPLVFIHGIGAGVMCYAEFIHQLSHSDRPIFLVELPYVAMRMVDKVPSAEETVLEISEMLHRFGYDNAIFVSHSLGTGVASWVMNMAPEIVAGMIMIDPICFLLHYHNVAFNFVHRIPKTLFEYIMYYGASRELYISNYISRHFQWYETIYFAQSTAKTIAAMTTPPPPRTATLPSSLTSKPATDALSNATIFLSEKDGIVGSACVYNYLMQKGVETHVMDGLEHAMFLTNTRWKKIISNQIEVLANKADILNTIKKQ